MAISRPSTSRRFRGQQDGLEFEGGLEILLHAPLAFADLVIKPRIFHRNRDRGRQQRQRARMILREVSDALAFQIQHADHAILQDQRHGDLRANAGMRGDVARIGGGVVDADHFAATSPPRL